MTEVRALFERVPVGWSRVSFAGRPYGVTRTVGVGGRTQTIFAEELGGSDVISANLYLTRDSEAFRPCEMPATKVTEFLAGLDLSAD